MLQLREEGGNGMGPFTLNERFMRSASSEDKDYFPQLFLVKSNIFLCGMSMYMPNSDAFSSLQ